MPLNKYYKGHGSSVMRDMKKRYGSDKGESVFYATANKRRSLIGDMPKSKKKGKR